FSAARVSDSSAGVDNAHPGELVTGFADVRVAGGSRALVPHPLSPTDGRPRTPLGPDRVPVPVPVVIAVARSTTNHRSPCEKRRPPLASCGSSDDRFGF